MASINTCFWLRGPIFASCNASDTPTQMILFKRLHALHDKKSKDVLENAEMQKSMYNLQQLFVRYGSFQNTVEVLRLSTLLIATSCLNSFLNS
uniref:Pentatricopeptide repeat-containing protein n=1 Tax=Heterorhabditis bacteriophora TaxID=37862 RepID=A0A1I7W934_HETBA